jgi:hypothetical protein
MAEATRMSKRQEARKRMQEVLQKLLDKHIPADESQPMKDGKFWEWEDMADQFDRELTGAFLEELAACSMAAELGEPGCCVHCGSSNTKWLQTGQRERQSKHGTVVLPRQVARCRQCGRTFSPSRAAVGPGHGGGADAAGGGAGGAGDGHRAV